MKKIRKKRNHYLVLLIIGLLIVVIITTTIIISKKKPQSFNIDNVYAVLNKEKTKIILEGDSLFVRYDTKYGYVSIEVYTDSSGNYMLTYKPVYHDRILSYSFDKDVIIVLLDNKKDYCVLPDKNLYTVHLECYVNGEKEEDDPNWISMNESNASLAMMSLQISVLEDNNIKFDDLAQTLLKYYKSLGF